MKIYCSNVKEGDVGGGWTFLRNFRKGMSTRVHFVDNWKDCDIFFMTSVTLTDKEDLYAAKKAGKKIVLRVDNVPRKSRNRRSSPHERLKEFSDLSDVVIYQSEWAKEYCMPLCGDGTVIYNGVDTEVFYPSTDQLSDSRDNRYLFAYHGKNEHKGFWHAHYDFQMEFRNNPKAEFWFIYDFGKDQEELHNADFDFWQGEKFTQLEKVNTAEDMADIMRQCKYFIYPSICDAAPNVVLEARACGMTVISPAKRELSGTEEMINLDDYSLSRMCQEYFGVFEVVMQN